MADGTVAFLLEKLTDLLVYHAQLIYNVKNHIDSLERDLRILKACLRKYSTNRRNKDDPLDELMRQVRDVCYKAENVLDSYVTQAGKAKSMSYFARVIHGSKRLLSIAEDVERIAKNVEELRNWAGFIHNIGDKNDGFTLNIGDRNDTGADDEGPLEDSGFVMEDRELPYCLRPYFLYLGMFPEDFEIPVWKLICMWIAEGFIQQRDERSPELIAEEYLNGLIDRNLVMVKKVSADGKIKACSIPKELHERCTNEARSERENFFQEIMGAGSTMKQFHRLCIRSNIRNFISGKHHDSGIRSFLCFSKEEIDLQRENISFIPKTFKFLRVLEAKPFNFKTFPSDLTQLELIRYICLYRSFIKVLPKAISKLWNLQTLIVYTSSGILDIRANIWKMEQLRHIKTNASAILPKPSKSVKKCEEFQTLGTISHKCCTEVLFNKISNLKKLGIRGRLAALLDAEGLENLEKLEKLKLVDEDDLDQASKGQLSSLPYQHNFPLTLRSLTLSKTFLDWHNISASGMLGTLKVLKLKNNVFTGDSWEVSRSGFQTLEALHIECPNLVTWVASGSQFPELRCLVLRKCKKLQEIPAGWGESLQKLELEPFSNSVVAIAMKIKEKKEESSRAGGFELIIIPADES